MPQPPTEQIPKKTALTVLIIVALLIVVPLIPALRQFGGLRAQQLLSTAKLPATTSQPASSSPGKGSMNPPAPPKASGKSSNPSPSSRPNASLVLPQANPYLFDPGGALHHFYDALQRTAQKEPGAVTLVLHYGDSPVTADSITADARAIFQSRFGDAGHGFVLIAKPWAWYGHRGIDLRAKDWKIEAATQSRAKDGFHGLGGVSFTGSEGASSSVRLPDDRHTRVQVFYLQQPGGGTFSVKAGDQTLGQVQTDGPEKKPGFAEFNLPPGSREIELDVISGSARLFGYSFEKPGPGIIYSSLGLNGAQVQAVLRFFDAKQWIEALRHEHPDLVVVNYGTNESVYPAYIEKQYPGELRQVIQRIKTALPDASLLVMSPMDRGQRDPSGQILTPPVLPRIVEIQHQVASELGCAFFNTFEAMGGSGTMARWYNSQPRLVSADFMHPLPAGAAKVGALLDEALIQGYEQYQNFRSKQFAQK
jgi:lysophospholipase L1-like esterase